MRVLLDENLPHDLRHHLNGHEAVTVAYMGWHGVENGALLAKAAEAGFGVVVTKDSGLEHEQGLETLPVAVVILRAASNSLDDLLPLVPALLEALAVIQPRTLVRVG